MVIASRRGHDTEDEITIELRNSDGNQPLSKDEDAEYVCFQKTMRVGNGSTSGFVSGGITCFAPI
jgi:hypothetical protein